MIRAHQPGSEPIDIPEAIPNPVVVPNPTPTPTEPAPKEPVRIRRRFPNAASREAGNNIWSSNASAERGDEVRKARRALQLKAHSVSVAFRVTEEEWRKSKS